MTSPMDRSARLARYATAGAIVPVAAIGGVAQADVYSGSFNDFTLTATSGSISVGGGWDTTNTGFYSFYYQTSGSANLNLNGLDFNIVASRYGLYSYLSSGRLLMTASGTQTVIGGDLVSAGQTFNEASGSAAPNAATALFGRSMFNSTNNSNLASGTHYLLFASGAGGPDAKYGWLSFSWNFTDYDNWSLSIDEWAWSDDGPLAAGATDDGSTTPVPGLGGLAALACGAAGMRRKRNRVA